MKSITVPRGQKSAAKPETRNQEPETPPTLKSKLPPKSPPKSVADRRGGQAWRTGRRAGSTQQRATPPTPRLRRASSNQKQVTSNE